MSKKPSKSIQAIIITLIAGMIIPKVFDISGNALLDKFLWKGVLSASFSVATIIVGMLYAGKFISGKVAGGKSRISIYFILIAIFASAASAVCAFIREISPIIKIVLASVTILAITLLIAKLIDRAICRNLKESQLLKRKLLLLLQLLLQMLRKIQLKTWKFLRVPIVLFAMKTKAKLCLNCGKKKI